MANEVIIKNNAKQVLRSKDDAVYAALEAVGMQAESHAKRNLKKAGRVDTGRLRTSVSHATEPKNGVVYIGTNVEYAPYVEYGTGIYATEGNGRKTPWFYKSEKDGKWHVTRGMKPCHFLKEAASGHTDQYLRIMKKYLKNTP